MPSDYLNDALLFFISHALCVAALKGSPQQDKPFYSVTAQLFNKYMCLRVCLESCMLISTCAVLAVHVGLQVL